MDEQHVDRFLEKARASQRKETAGLPQPSPDGQATLRAAKGYTTAGVRGWLAEVRTRKTKDGKPKVKKAQLEMLQIVVDRVCDELGNVADPLTKRKRSTSSAPSAKQQAKVPVLGADKEKSEGRSAAVEMSRVNTDASVAEAAQGASLLCGEPVVALPASAACARAGPSAAGLQRLPGQPTETRSRISARDDTTGTRCDAAEAEQGDSLLRNEPHAKSDRKARTQPSRKQMKAPLNLCLHGGPGTGKSHESW